MKSMLQMILESCDSCHVHSYSGRGMDGRTCLGVTTDGSISEVFSEIIENIDDGYQEEIADAVRSMRTDDMGTGKVLYWPRIKFVGDETPEAAGR
jgi:hypothetical protein